MNPGADMLPTAAVFTTDEIFAQTSDFAMDRPATPPPPALDVAEFLCSIAAGYFTGSNDTFRLEVSDAA